MRIPREVPSIYLRAAVLRILTHWAVSKDGHYRARHGDRAHQLGDRRFPARWAGRKPALVIKVVMGKCRGASR